MRTTTLKAPVTGALLAMAMLVIGTAWAKDVSIALSGAAETPPVQTSASGSGTLSIGEDRSVSGSVKTMGIESTAAHVHLGAPGKAGPPIITLTKGADGMWSVPAGSKLDDAQYASFKAGDLYVNVHSAAHKDGEIRGQLKP